MRKDDAGDVEAQVAGESIISQAHPSMKAASVDFGHGECWGGMSVLGMPGEDLREAVSPDWRAWVVGLFSREVRVSLVGLQGLPLVMDIGWVFGPKQISFSVPFFSPIIISCYDDDILDLLRARMLPRGSAKFIILFFIFTYTHRSLIANCMMYESRAD